LRFSSSKGSTTPSPALAGNVSEGREFVQLNYSHSLNAVNNDNTLSALSPTPIQMTTNRKLALPMGRFTAEDPVQSLQKLPV
jgi:hypothetical protein